jgi:hypothetical protein
MSQRRRLAGAQTGARTQKALQIRMSVEVSKTVSGLWVRRGFKSLPLRSYRANPLAMRVCAYSTRRTFSPPKSVEVH